MASAVAVPRVDSSASTFVVSWLPRSVSVLTALAKVGNPFDDLGVVRSESAVRFIMLQRAHVIAEIQLAQNGKVPVPIVKVWELCQGCFKASAPSQTLPCAAGPGR